MSVAGILPNVRPSPAGPTRSVPLSPVENYFWRFEQDLDGAFRVVVLVRLDGLVEGEVLALALEELQKRHPKLRSVIVNGAGGELRYEFGETGPPIPFEIIDCGEAGMPWRESTRRLLHSELRQGESLAAVTVLRSPSRGCCELLFMAPHAIADGMSAIMLANDLLTEYARAEGKLTLERPALSIVTALRAKRSGGLGGRWRLFRRFLRLKRLEGRVPLTSLPEAPAIPPQSQWERWVFTPEQTLALVKRCRKERTSLSGAMVAAACCGIRHCLPAQQYLFKWQIPFNVRELLRTPAGPVTGEDLGCFVSNMNGLVNMAADSDFWDVARAAGKELQTFIEEDGPSFGYNASTILFGAHLAVNQWFKGRIPKMKPSSVQRETLLATHYGVVNMRDSYGSLRPRECTLMFKNEITGPSLVMECLILGQRLNVGFAADDLDPAFWERLYVAVRQQLDSAMGTAKSSGAGV